MIFRFWVSAVCGGSPWAEIEVWAGLCSSQKLWTRIHSLAFSSFWKPLQFLEFLRPASKPAVQHYNSLSGCHPLIRPLPITWGFTRDHLTSAKFLLLGLVTESQVLGIRSGRLWTKWVRYYSVCYPRQTCFSWSSHSMRCFLLTWMQQSFLRFAWYLQDLRGVPYSPCKTTVCL